MIFITSKTSDGNMSIFCGDPTTALNNQKKFSKKLGIDYKNIIELKQIHGNRIIKIDQPTVKINRADGLITNRPKLYLMIKAADCHQIGFYDPKNKAIGLIHAGFKGLKKGIIKKVIEKMAKFFKSDPKDLIVKLGPSIGPCCYRMDIWKKAEKQLTDCGVLEKNIGNPRICTYESEDYFSHRRAEDKKENDFRFMTILGL